MSENKPLIVVEPAAIEAASKVAVGYEIASIPGTACRDFSDFSDRKVILWPDATQASREAFRLLGSRLAEICSEIKMIVPTGRPDGWNIATAVQEGMAWQDIAAWAKNFMLVFNRGEFPHLQVETMEAPDLATADQEGLWNELGLARAGNAAPVMNADNVVRILSRFDGFKNMIWYDEFYQRYFTNWNTKPEQGPREWRDIDDVNLTVTIQREFGLMRMTQNIVSEGVRCRGFQVIKNEPKEWMKSLRWDGKCRVDTFFSNYFGVVLNQYTMAVSRNFWVGMVARIFQPGCQLDNMVILEGKQGIFKSKALEAIGGKWYMEAAEEITSKDFFVALAGKLIVEIADLDSFSRADTNRIKKVITCRTDRYRQPYGRATQDHPRQSIFVGTTNEQHYLKDATGARRFWPIPCGNIRLESIREDRKQLFAEAVTRYLANQDWYKVPQELALDAQEERRQFDEWENVIGDFLRGLCATETTVVDVAASVGIDKAHLDVSVQRRIGNIMRRMGWESRAVRRDGSVKRMWVVRGSESPAAEEQPERISPPPAAARS